MHSQQSKFGADAQLNRLPKRGVYDKHAVHAILDEALFCTVSYVNDDSTPVTIPTNFVRIGESIVVHGKSSAGYIRALATGRRACITMTLVCSAHVFIVLLYIPICP